MVSRRQVSGLLLGDEDRRWLVGRDYRHRSLRQRAIPGNRPQQAPHGIVEPPLPQPDVVASAATMNGRISLFRPCRAPGTVEPATSRETQADRGVLPAVQSENDRAEARFSQTAQVGLSALPEGSHATYGEKTAAALLVCKRRPHRGRACGGARSGCVARRSFRDTMLPRSARNPPEIRPGRSQRKCAAHFYVTLSATEHIYSDRHDGRAEVDGRCCRTQLAWRGCQSHCPSRAPSKGASIPPESRLGDENSAKAAFWG